MASSKDDDDGVIRNTPEYNPHDDDDDTSLITTIRRNDVLLGRGAFCISHVGNVMFRDICQQYRDDYHSTRDQKSCHKSKIANRIVAIVQSNGGRFLRNARTTTTTSKQHKVHHQDSNYTPSARTWVIADRNAVVEKVKQTLREKQYQPKVKNVANMAVAKEQQPASDNNNDNDQVTVAPMPARKRWRNRTNSEESDNDYDDDDDNHHQDRKRPAVTTKENPFILTSAQCLPDVRHHQPSPTTSNLPISNPLLILPIRTIQSSLSASLPQMFRNDIIINNDNDHSNFRRAMSDTVIYEPMVPEHNISNAIDHHIPDNNQLLSNNPFVMPTHHHHEPNAMIRDLQRYILWQQQQQQQQQRANLIRNQITAVVPSLSTLPYNSNYDRLTSITSPHDDVNHPPSASSFATASFRSDMVPHRLVNAGEGSNIIRPFNSASSSSYDNRALIVADDNPSRERLLVAAWQHNAATTTMMTSETNRMMFHRQPDRRNDDHHDDDAAEKKDPTRPGVPK